MSVSSLKERRDQVAALTVEHEKRMVDVLPIVAVVVGAFLLSMSGIRARVEVQ